MTLVSLIIPCHDAEATLRETLDSAFAQTGADLEIIAVDDGSTDGTAALLDGEGGRVQVVHGPNRGAAEARNLGTRLAKGDFLLYLDADDLLLPGAVAAKVAALEATGADVAYSDWERLREVAPGRYESGAPVARTLASVHPDPVLAVLTDFWCPPAALLYRRDLVARLGGWRQDLAPVEDARFLLDAALAGARFVHVPGVAARYRIPLAPSHSRRSRVRFARSVFHSAAEVEAAWRAEGRLDPERRQALARVYAYAARELFREDLETFRSCEAAWRALGLARGLAWPSMASRLEHAVGHRAALALLRAVGRGAP